MSKSSIIVTGGGSGIGAATARRLAREGVAVCVADINVENAANVAAQIENAGGSAFGIAIDVAKGEDNQRMVEETIARFGSLTGLFLNAGIAKMSTVREYDVATWQRVLDVNLTAVFHGMGAAVPHLKEGSSIVITSSTAGKLGAFSSVAYCASKAGVIGLMKSAAAELARDGIRVNAICPGTIDTPINGELPPELIEKIFAPRAPLRRAGKSEEVAELAAFLLSDKASFITAEAITVDGGSTGAMPEGDPFPLDRGFSVSELFQDDKK